MKLNFRAVIEVVERLVVIAAAGLAIIPVYQWYSEAEDRRLERVTSFISAGSECFDYTDERENNLIMWLDTDIQAIRNTSFARMNVAYMCSELYERLYNELVDSEFRQPFLDYIIDWATMREFNDWIEATAPSRDLSAPQDFNKNFPQDFIEWYENRHLPNQ